MRPMGNDERPSNQRLARARARARGRETNSPRLPPRPCTRPPAHRLPRHSLDIYRVNAIPPHSWTHNRKSFRAVDPEQYTSGSQRLGWGSGSISGDLARKPFVATDAGCPGRSRDAAVSVDPSASAPPSSTCCGHRSALRTVPPSPPPGCRPKHGPLPAPVRCQGSHDPVPRA